MLNRSSLLSALMALGLLTAGSVFHDGLAADAYATALDDPGSRTAGTAGGGLTAVVPEIDAGQVTIGATAQVVMRFRNEGTKDIKISQIDLYPSSTVSAGIAVDDCSKAPLAGGSECAVVVTVKGLKAGHWRVEALVRHDGKARITTDAMKGTVESSSDTTDTLLSDLEMIPNEIDFGSLNSGRPIVKTVIMRNVTSEPLEVTKVTVSPENSGYSLSSECAKLDPGAACAASITWSPTSKGHADGVLLVEHTGSTKVASVDLKGDYDPDEVEKANIFPEAVAGMGLLVSSQEDIDFGTISNEASITVSLVNVGDTDMTISGIQLGGVENGLSVSRSGCHSGTVLHPVEACPLTLTWAAVREGTMIDDVQIHHDGARGILVIPVKGTASSAVNKDTKAVIVQSATTGKEEVVIKPADKSAALEGFVVTSHSDTRAIINGPGGSRVVSQNQQLVLGGIPWIVDITSQGVDFTSGKDKIRLLFDRSLSSVNRTTSQSTSSSSSSGTTGSSPASSGATRTSTISAPGSSK